MNRQAGVVTAFVRTLQDPEGEGRVGLEYRWLPGGDTLPTVYAPVAAPLAGPDRGAFFMPEEGDEVLVAFDKGDWDHPYIVGFLWNGEQSPPESSYQNRVIVTPGGHTLRFEDATPKKIVLRSDSGHEIELDDAGGTVTVKSKGGQRVELTDTPPSAKVTTTAGQQITLSDVPPSITISAPTGMLTVNCLQASVNAAALLSVNAPVAQFSGVVMASAIVASAYTPAPGNTFGL